MSDIDHLFPRSFVAKFESWEESCTAMLILHQCYSKTYVLLLIWSFFTSFSSPFDMDCKGFCYCSEWLWICHKNITFFFQYIFFVFKNISILIVTTSPIIMTSYLLVIVPPISSDVVDSFLFSKGISLPTFVLGTQKFLLVEALWIYLQPTLYCPHIPT